MTGRAHRTDRARQTDRTRRTRGARRACLRDDRGSGTVLTLAVVAVIVLVAGLIGLLAGALLAHARAQGAADLAALAAAGRLQRQALFPGVDHAAAGDGSVGAGAAPCALAQVVAGRNRAQLRGCEVGPAGTVTVEVGTSGPTGAVTARARAGPRPPAAGA